MAATVCLIGACGGDPPDLWQPPPLNGEYDGFYVIETPAVRDSQPVLISLGDDTYVMKLDTASAYFGSHSFCTVSGQYAVTEGVRFVEMLSGPIGGEHGGVDFDECNPEENPTGTFTMIRADQGATLLLQQQTNDTLAKELNLQLLPGQS